MKIMIRNRLVVILFTAFTFPVLGETVIPIEIRMNPLVRVLIDEVPLVLLIDLGGAGHVRLNSSVVKSLGIATEPSTSNNTDVYGEMKRTGTFTLPRLNMGGMVFDEIPAFTTSSGDSTVNEMPDWMPKIDGTIGREFLKQFVVVFDYRGSTMTLYEHGDTGLNGCSGPAIPLIPHDEGIIVTEAEVDHGTVTAIWDTGATHSFIKKNVAEKRGFPLVKDDENNEFYESERFQVGPTEFGPLEFLALPFVEPENVDVYVGYNFFANHVVCVNSEQGTITIQTNS